MGLFTEEDVKEVEKAVDEDFPYLKKEKKIKFIDGFFKGWKKAKKSKSELNFDEVLRFLIAGIDNAPDNYGKAFGTLVGDVEADYKEQERLLQRGYFEWIGRGINTIKAKPHLWTMIMRRLDKWKDKVKLEELTTEQRVNYGTLVANLK